MGICSGLLFELLRCLSRRFNLSEFSHPSKFNRLTGGDPNYVGYKEGGELTNFIRQAEERRAKKLGGKATAHTSCVILFDEVCAMIARSAQRSEARSLLVSQARLCQVLRIPSDRDWV
eukprot:6259-Pleurochrysis_carterae.AAC.4